MVILSILHQVRDYDEWKAVFDTFPPSGGGALWHRVARGVDDPNLVSVAAGFPTLEMARAFGAQPGLADAMERSGVLGAPRVEMFEAMESVDY